MPYKYRIIWKRGRVEEVCVEAWPKMKSLALSHEKRRPSFIIGKVKGIKVSFLRPYLLRLQRKYPSKMQKAKLIIEIPDGDIRSISEAYRIGFAATALAKSKSINEAEKALNYILSCPDEEIWFWTSKYLKVIGEGTTANKVIKAILQLC